MNCSKMIGLTLVFWGYLKTKRKVDIFSVYEKFFFLQLADLHVVQSSRLLTLLYKKYSIVQFVHTT